MIKSQPEVEMTAKYELKDAALALEISPSCLIKWTAKGYLKCGHKKVNGRRFWTGAELLRAWKAQI